MQKEKEESKIVIDRLTGKPIAYRDDSDAGLTEELSEEDNENEEKES